MAPRRSEVIKGPSAHPTMPPNHNNEATTTYVPELDGAIGPWFRLPVGLAARRNLVAIAATFSAETCRGMSEVIEAMDAPLAQVLDDLGLPRLPPEDSFWHGHILPILQRRLRRAERPAGAYRGDNLFARVKEAVAVEDLAMRYTDLKPAGSGKLKGQCPLHHERTASFYVFTDSGRWRCFGRCAEGGDVINLAQRLIDRGLM